MIHKKKPILLISVVGSLGLVLLGLNMSQYLRNQDRYQEIPAPDRLTREKLGERPESLVGGGDARIAAMEEAILTGEVAGATVIADVPANPSILLPNLRYYQEQYTDGNTTSAGWYNENSYQQTEAENRRKAAGESN